MEEMVPQVVVIQEFQLFMQQEIRVVQVVDLVHLLHQIILYLVEQEILLQQLHLKEIMVVLEDGNLVLLELLVVAEVLVVQVIVTVLVKV